ncbi:MAG: twin-arginine translocase TatA/TatE family subunit [Chloroflexota bacterium]|nr:twin-arginine translocase TatA/TatE family subunit [Chloroflexota bacterium]
MRPPGPWEIILILVVVLIIFGAGKLPQVFRSAGQGIREFRKASQGEVDEDKNTKKTTKKPAEKK